MDPNFLRFLPGASRLTKFAGLIAMTVSACLVATLVFVPSSSAATSLRFEFESLPVGSSSGDAVRTGIARCPGNRCVIFESNQVGDFVTYEVNVPQAVSYEVRIATKRFPSRGVFQLAIQGAPNPQYDGGFDDRGAPVDLYASSAKFKEVSLGVVHFGTAGKKRFRFTVTGKNAQSSGFTLGLDSIVLFPKSSTTVPGGPGAPTPSTSSTSTSTSTTTKVPTPTSTTVIPVPPPSSGQFVHPGIVVSRSQLDLVKAKLAAHQEPWSSALEKARRSRFGSLSWQPTPVAVVGCGAYSNPNEGCTEETDDAQAAYTSALIWYYTGDRRYAAKSIEILNAWSSKLQTHKFDTKVYKNGRLQAAWAAETFTKAAEIIRYSNAGWSAADVSRFEAMLNKAFLPMVKDGWTGGQANWQLSMAEATMNIGVFTNNRDVFLNGVDDWRQQLKAAIYLKSDGAQPIVPAGTVIKTASIPSYWYTPKAFVDGLEQETCRDLGHTAFGFAAAFNAAETGYIQGLNLYGEEQRRLTEGMEYNVRFLNNPGASGWVCREPLKLGGLASTATWEIGYNHFVSRKGMQLPQTRQFLSSHRPTASALHFSWETLTHAGGQL